MLLLATIIIISVIVFYFSGSVMIPTENGSGLKMVVCLISYICLIYLFNWLEQKFPNKFLKTINFIIVLPAAIFTVLYQLTIPSITLIFNVILFLLVSLLIPLFLIKVNTYLEIFNLTTSTEVFIVLSLIAIISLTFHKQILNFLYKYGPSRLKDSKKMKKYNLEEIIEYVVNKENIRFMIYTVFFIYLVIFSFQLLQEESIFEVKEIDKAVLQSFLCFLAYDRLLLNSSRFILLPSVLLNKFLNSMAAKDDK